MAEGDYGIQLPITISGATVTALDSLRFSFKNRMNGNAILEKTLFPVENVTALVFTEAESELFSVGQYVYKADWYQDGVFMCNIIPSGIFKVVDKA